MAPAVILAVWLALQTAPPSELPAARPSADAFHDFPVFVWRQDFQGEVLPARLFAPFGGVNVEGSGSIPRIEGAQDAAAFYVGHAPGREEFHLRRTDPWYDAMWQQWYEERDESLLVRQPCLSDPKTREKLLAQLERSLAARDGNFGSAISLGDEVGLTPAGDPLDLCHSEFCSERAPEKDASTDEARLAWLEDDTSLIGPWLDRRRYHTDVVHKLLADVAASARRLAPAAPRALFGVKTQTAFGGVDVTRALEFVEWIEPYGDTLTRELCFTLRRADQRILATLFPANDRPERAALRLAEHVLRGGQGAVIWSDRHLARSAAYLDRLARAVRETRALRAQIEDLLGRPWAPQTSGWAVFEDSEAVALSFLRDSLGDGPTWPRRFAGYQVKHGTRESALNQWLRALEDAGRLPGALPLVPRTATNPVELRERFPIWLLVEQSLLSREDESRLWRHLESGGVLVCQGRFAEFLRDGTRRASPFAAWREQFEDQVFRGPESLEELATWVTKIERAAGLPSSVLQVRGARVLRAEMASQDSLRIVALLPRPEEAEDTGEDEESLSSTKLVIELDPGWEITGKLASNARLFRQDGDPPNLTRAEIGVAEALYLSLQRRD